MSRDYSWKSLFFNVCFDKKKNNGLLENLQKKNNHWIIIVILKYLVW